jgi:hypothetical protein
VPERGGPAAGAGGTPAAALTRLPTPSALDRYALVFFVASLVMGVGVALWNASRHYADWPNTSDDMFYYLVLARETAQHGIVSADGLRPTNGFHPLWFLVLRAIQPLLPPAALPGAALAILALAHAGASIVLWRTLRRLAGPGLAASLAGLYAANPFVLGVVFAGVETALAAFFVAVCLWAHLRWLEHRRAADRWLSLCALGLAVAARTDTVMLAAALAGSAALARLRATRDLGLASRAVDWAPVVAAFVPVLAFGVWSLAATGEFLQTSGRALSFWQSVGDWRLIRATVAGLGPLATPITALVYALEVGVQFIGWITRAPIELLGAHPLGVMLVAGAFVARLTMGRSEAREAAGSDPGEPPRSATAPTDSARRRLTGELVLFFIVLWGFYALLFRHCQVWYWHTSIYAAALLAGMWLAPIRRVGPPALALLASPRVPRGTMALLLIAAIALTARGLNDLQPRRPVADSTGAAAANPLAMIPDRARLGAFDTGRLGWEHPRLEVVNLDGLVNNAAYRALRARRIGRYMLEEGVEWLYVRDRVVDRFRAFGLQAWLDQAEPVGRSADGVALYRIRRAAPTL